MIITEEAVIDQVGVIARMPQGPILIMDILTIATTMVMFVAQIVDVWDTTVQYAVNKSKLSTNRISTFGCHLKINLCSYIF